MIDVIARLADSVLEITRVPPGGSYRAHDGSMLVVAGKPVVEQITIGLVSYEVHSSTRVAPLARKPVEKRFYGYLAVSLVAQLALWLAAALLATFEKLVHHTTRPVRIAHVREPDPPPPPKPAPKPEPKKPEPATERNPSAPAAHREKPEKPDELDKLYGNPAAQMQHLAKVMAEIDVQGKLAHTDGPLYLPENDDSGFGGAGGHMQYDDKTYKVERWAIPTFTRTHKGELAPVPSIEWCDDGSCSTRGPLELKPVLAQLLAHEAEIARCYREHTGDLVGNVRVRFPIGPDGKVTGTLGTEAGPVGYGTGTVGRCVAAIAQRIRWPRANDETYVFVGLAFRPAAG